MSWWNLLVFLHAGTSSHKLKDDKFLGEECQMDVISLVMGLQNWLYLKNGQME